MAEAVTLTSFGAPQPTDIPGYEAGMVNQDLVN